MIKRTPKNQSKHDARVRKIAGGYLSQGWKVSADIPGHHSPKIIYGKQPDIIAKRGVKERIVEVETRDSYKKDIPQRNAFRRYASKDKNRRFRTEII